MSDKITVNRANYSLNCSGRLIDLSEPIVMGILNATPDSFYEGSRVSQIDNALKNAERMQSEGATILDLGGMSSRPGAQIIDSKEEQQRIIPILKELLKAFPKLFISIDTIHAATAAACLELGASIINDISGGLFDDYMLDTVATYQAPYVCMHMKGEPTTMTKFSNYENLMLEQTDYFINRINNCNQKGIKDIIIDPGFGFAKSISQNFELLNRFKELNFLDKPMLIGISRKSMIWKTLNTTPDEALNGTTALNMIALQNGASILRVHDVKEAMECIKLNKLLSKS